MGTLSSRQKSRICAAVAAVAFGVALIGYLVSGYDSALLIGTTAVAALVNVVMVFTLRPKAEPQGS